MIHLSTDVQCHWSENPPSYRIYVDGDMLTERTFRWAGYQNYIREHIVCELAPGLHMIRVENCTNQGSFKLSDLVIEGVVQLRAPGDTEQQYTFVV